MKNKKKSRVLSEINVVPYIDVMLVLLVIFMVTTPILTQGISITLPNAKGDSVTQKSLFSIVSMSKDKKLYYAEGTSAPIELTAKALFLRLKAEQALDSKQGHKRKIYLRADKDIDYGDVVSTMSLIKSAGMTQVGLLTEPSNIGQA